MKIIHVQKEVIGWEDYAYEVPDDFNDYQSLVNSMDWFNWEYLEEASVNTGKYEMQHPIVWNYNHTKQEPADLFPYNGCHDLFSIVENNGTGNDFPTMRGIHHGLPENVAAEIKEAYDHCCYETEYAGEKHLYTPTVRWFSYADMYIYCLEHPEVIGEMIIARSVLSIGLSKEDHMSWYCIHEKTWSGTLYEPPEAWCELNEDCDCEDCPHRYSQEDYEDDRADYEYERYRDSFDF